MRHDLELLARLGPAEYARRLKRARRPSGLTHRQREITRAAPHDAARGEELIRTWLAPRRGDVQA